MTPRTSPSHSSVCVRNFSDNYKRLYSRINSGIPCHGIFPIGGKSATRDFFPIGGNFGSFFLLFAFFFSDKKMAFFFGSFFFSDFFSAVFFPMIFPCLFSPMFFSHTHHKPDSFSGISTSAIDLSRDTDNKYLSSCENSICVTEDTCTGKMFRVSHVDVLHSRMAARSLLILAAHEEAMRVPFFGVRREGGVCRST